MNRLQRILVYDGLPSIVNIISQKEKLAKQSISVGKLNMIKIFLFATEKTLKWWKI